MSNRLLTRAWNLSEISPVRKIILLRLADRADDEGKCFPGHKSLAEDCGVSERTVRDELRALKSTGHITMTENSRRSGRGFSRFIYSVHPLAPEAASAVTQEVGALDTGKSEQRHRKMSASPNIGNPQLTQRGTCSQNLKNSSGGLLAKDRERIKRQIQEESQNANPTKGLLAGLEAALKAINDELANRGEAFKPSMPKPEPVTPDPKIEISQQEEAEIFRKMREGVGFPHAQT